MKPRLVLVSGPWGCGSTAVAGALIHAGLIGFGPYFRTRDLLTPSSYEWCVFRDWVLQFTSEETLSLTVKSPDIVRAAARRFCDDIVRQVYSAYDPAVDPPLVMKYALSCLLLPALAEVFQLQLVVVTRPLAAIEATAQRRQWGPQFGSAGVRSSSMPSCLVYWLSTVFQRNFFPIRLFTVMRQLRLTSCFELVVTRRRKHSARPRLSLFVRREWPSTAAGECAGGS